MFADSGIPMMFREAYEKGAQKRRLQVRVAGGARMMDEQGVFNIGQRNCLAMRKIFWKAGVIVHAEETGGKIARTMRFEIASGPDLSEVARTHRLRGSYKRQHGSSRRTIFMAFHLMIVDDSAGDAGVYYSRDLPFGT